MTSETTWDETDQKYGRKVDYRLRNGFRSTAYLDQYLPDRDVFTGTDKYTDEPVTVRWTGDQYEEQP